jgi:four helix bundle protein
MIDEHELCERVFRFACDVAKLCIRLQERGPVMMRLSMKLLDSGTSIGANIEEGRAGQTKPDFIAKNFIRIHRTADDVPEERALISIAR